MSQNLPIQKDSPKHGGGPATAAGKEKSKMNAVKSGLYSRQMLIKTEFYSEDEEALRQLESALREQLCPEGAMEEIYMHQILIYNQRLMHAAAYEAGRLSEQLQKWGAGCKKELVTLQNDIERMEKELGTLQKRLETLTQNHALEWDDLTESETEYLLARVRSRLGLRESMDWSLDKEGTQLFEFLWSQLSLDVHRTRPLLIKHLEGVKSKVEATLSELHSELEAKTESLSERLSHGAQQLLILDNETYATIERSRNSDFKHLKIATEMLMKFQAFRLQKKRLEEVPFNESQENNTVDSVNSLLPDHTPARQIIPPFEKWETPAQRIECDDALRDHIRETIQHELSQKQAPD